MSHPDLRSISPVPPLSSIGTRWQTRIATIREKLGTLTNGSEIMAPESGAMNCEKFITSYPPSLIQRKLKQMQY